jgi:glycosyltransferase involved in cell wall biosynthesis
MEQGACAARIGIIGQVGSWKGHDDMLEAFALVARSHPAGELHVFGRGSDDYERRLKHRAEALGVGSRITWHGFVSDRATIFQSIDICAVPSRCEESFGLVAAEAGFFGLPVVASRRGGLPEIVEDGVTGFLVEAGQPAELAARVRMLFDDEPLRQLMGQQARARVAARFGHERLIDDFTHLLEGQPNRKAES